MHVDPPDDVVAEHRRDELAAQNEEIEDLKSSVSGFITIVREKEQEIVELQARVENLMTRQNERILFVGDILDEMRDAPRYHGNNEPYMIKFREGLEAQPGTIKLTKKEIMMLLERRASFDSGAAVSFDNGPDYHDDPPVEQDDEPAASRVAVQTWDEFVAVYRAIEAPLALNHLKLIAGMVHWADENGHDIEQLAGAPQEAVEIWTMTAKNFRGHTVAGDSQRETTAKILQRFGDQRRHSIAAMASSLGLKEKFLAGVLDMMLKADHRGMIMRDADGKSWKYTFQRPAK